MAGKDVHRIFHRDMHNLMLGGMMAWVTSEIVFLILGFPREPIPFFVIVGSLGSFHWGRDNDAFILTEGV